MTNQDKNISEKAATENLVNLAETADLVHDLEIDEPNTPLHKAKKLAKSFLSKAKDLKDKQKDLAEKAITKARTYSPYVDKFITVMDDSITYLTKTNPLDGRPEVVQETRSPSVFGIWILVFTFGFCMMWALFAPLDSASHAMGRIILESQKRIIQHPDMGIVKKILVQEGEEVKQGQALVILDDKTLKAQKNEIELQYFFSLAELSRLIAERDKLENISFPSNLLAHQDNPEIKKMMDNQEKFFLDKKSSLVSKISIYEKVIAGNNEKKNAISAQIESINKQIQIVDNQIATGKRLLANANYSKAALQELESRKAQMDGNKGEYLSRLAETDQNILQSESTIHNIKEEASEKTSQELKQAQTSTDVAKEKLTSVTEHLKRTVITSPTDGKVSNILETLSHHGLVGQNQILMEIIPQNDKLIIEAKVEAKDIAVVRVGQTARVRLTAFRARIVPVLEGKVINLSPDAFMENTQKGPQPFYKARIEIDKKQLDDVVKLKSVVLFPGMQAEVMIILGSRTMMEYLLDPIITSLSKSFIER